MIRVVVDETVKRVEVFFEEEDLPQEVFFYDELIVKW